MPPDTQDIEQESEMWKKSLIEMLAGEAVTQVGGRMVDDWLTDKMEHGSMQIGERINAFNKVTDQRVRIPDADRLRHLWVVGRTGSGKSTLLLNMIFQDMRRGHGICVIDPKGDLIDAVLRHVPAKRRADVVLFDPTDADNVIGFNMFERSGTESTHIVFEHFIAVFQKLLKDSLGVTVNQLLTFTVLALLEIEGATVADISEMLYNDDFRERVLAQVTDPVVLDFWHQQYNTLSKAQQLQRASTITNKLTEWIATKLVRYVVYQSESTIDMRHIMDNRQILLVKIPQGILGENGSAFLGALIVSKLQVTAMGRTGLQGNDCPRFFLYVDEFQNFVTSSFAKILSEARAYGLGLVVANQYDKQLDKDLEDALINNVAGVAQCIRQGKSHLIHYNKPLPDDQFARVRMLALGPPQGTANARFVDNIKATSRCKYTVPVGDVEADIALTRAIRKTDAQYVVEPGMQFGEAI